MTMQAPITTAQIQIAALDLRQAVHKLKMVVEKRNTIPVLSTILIKAKAGSSKLTATVTDLDIEMTLTVPAEASKTFNCTIPFKALEAVAKAAKGPVGIAHKDDLLTFMTGDATMTRRIISPPEDFPKLDGDLVEQMKNTKPTKISEGDLHRLIHLSRHCISSEETRYYLNGIFLTKDPDTGMARAVATDGHRLARIDTDFESDAFSDVIIHSKLVGILHSLTRAGGNQTIKFGATEQRVFCEMNGVKLISKMIDGTYPDYNRVIPSDTTTSRCALTDQSVHRLGALQTAFDNDLRTGVKLDPANGLMEIRDSYDNYAAVPLQGTGDAPIGFNLRYLATQAGVTPEFKVEWADKGSPARITGEDPKALWILMPMRV